MSKTVSGIYRRGAIRLLEAPTGVHEGRVLVTVSQAEETKAGQELLKYGKYSHGRMSTEEDFKIAEWRGEDLGIDG